MDVLADVLSATKIGGTVTARVHAAGPWGIEFPHLPSAVFHHVSRGSCWLRLPGAGPLPLTAGDLVLLPAGTGHVMAGDPTGPTVRFEDVTRAQRSGPGTPIDFPGPGPRTSLVCGGYRFDTHASHPLLTLPPVLLLRADPSARRHDLTETLRMLTAELADPAPGSQTITDRLVDVLFVHVLRQWEASRDAPDRGAGWWAALRDAEVAAAISLIHEGPGRAWTVDALAREVGVSRATLSRRFTRLVGEPPLAYLTRWRLEIAARRLRDTKDSVTRIANSVGYTSEFAFSRAFTRHRGTPPSRYRATHSAPGAGRG
ncbi:AraC family transcriptional regulator [Streptomyces sp. CB01881]|uniref:AraC family transcriptional regulator n=1 Tax=Streptomyces sp. CB01881 TaxID=2078691 RepID=UPI000CDCD52E|nr:AraC family transcriptional regulator [Streptomyces sp. CB01881]AUY52633.1 AraC family transcriptional regulator [Streptomyces sp. CB01881]TYC70352.1 AraC family transcriptional regulator [Streptomyces sp. CB01881]